MLANHTMCVLCLGEGEKGTLPPTCCQCFPRLAKDTFGLLFCKNTLLLNFLSRRSTEPFLAELLSSQLPSRVCWCLRLFLSAGFGITVWIAWDFSNLQRSLWVVVQPFSTSQFYVTFKLAEGVLSLIVQVKVLNNVGPSSSPWDVLQGTGCTAGLGDADNNPSNPTVQAVFSPPHSLLI